MVVFVSLFTLKKIISVTASAWNIARPLFQYLNPNKIKPTL